MANGDGRVRGKHENGRRVVALRPNVLDHVESAQMRHVQVQQEQIGIRVLLDQPEQAVDAVGAMHPDVRHGSQHGALQRVAKQRMVVGDQYIRHAG